MGTIGINANLMTLPEQHHQRGDLAVEFPPSFSSPSTDHQPSSDPHVRVPEELLSTQCMASTSSLEGEGASVHSLDPAPSLLSFADSLATDLTAANDPFGLDGGGGREGGRDGVGFLGPGLGRSHNSAGEERRSGVKRMGGWDGGRDGGGRDGGGWGEAGVRGGRERGGWGRNFSWLGMRSSSSSYLHAGGPSVKTRTKTRGQRLVEVRTEGMGARRETEESLGRKEEGRQGETGGKLLSPLYLPDSPFASLVHL